MEVYLHLLLTSILQRSQCLTLHSYRVTSEKEKGYPSNRRPGRPQSPIGYFEKREKILAFSGIQTPDHQPAALLLYQLRHPDLPLNKASYQSFIYSPTDALVSCLKKILKFTLKFSLKQLRHVSVLQLHHHQGVNYSCLLKLQLLTILFFKTTHLCICWWTNETLVTSRCHSIIIPTTAHI